MMGWLTKKPWCFDHATEVPSGSWSSFRNDDLFMDSSFILDCGSKEVLKHTRLLPEASRKQSQLHLDIPSGNLT